MADTTPFQPVLPAELPFSDAEIQFMDESPPGLFPDNQNSNLGLIRKIFAGQVQELIDQQQTIYNERFVNTSEIYLDEWEEQMGLPTNPSGFSTQQRRVEVAGRLVRGPFTNARRAAVVEKYIVPTLTGAATQLTPAGVPIDAAGIPLFSGEAGDVKQFYRIYQIVRNFTYEVRIKSTITPNTAALNRELTRITPAGITYTFTSAANILDYSKAVIHKTPIGYWRLGSAFTDSSGFGNNGTSVGTSAAIADPGLLASTAISGSNGATDFDGSSGHVTVASSASIQTVNTGQTWEAWIRPDALPAAGNFMMILSAQASPNYISVFNNTGLVAMSMMIGGTQRTVASPPGAVAAGTIYHVAGVWDGDYLRMYINGVQVAQAGPWTGGVLSPGALYIGRYSSPSYFFNGALDEVALYGHALSPADVLDNYKTGKNLL